MSGKMNFKPAFIYQLKDFLLGSAPFFGVIAAVIVIVSAQSGFSGDVNFNGYGMAAAICLFVFGVVVPRQDLRLCVQMGVSRRTAFFSNLAAALTDSAVLAVAGELLMICGKAIGGSEVLFADLYQFIYESENLSAELTFGQHIAQIVFNTALMFACFCFGMFFTYLFWRLNKVGIAAAIVSIILVVNGVPAILYHTAKSVSVLERAGSAFANWICSSSWNFILSAAATAALFSLISWLLLRRANIKEPSSR